MLSPCLIIRGLLVQKCLTKILKIITPSILPQSMPSWSSFLISRSSKMFHWQLWTSLLPTTVHVTNLQCLTGVTKCCIGLRCHLSGQFFTLKSDPGFVQVLEILESPGSSRNHIPGLERPGKTWNSDAGPGILIGLHLFIKLNVLNFFNKIKYH